MAVIKLTIQLDKASLESTIKEINSELGKIKGLNIKVDNSGAKAAQSLAANIQGVTKATEAAARTIKKTETEIDGVIKKTTELTKVAVGEYEQLVKAKGKETKTFIHNEEEKRKAAQKTADEAEKRRVAEYQAAEQHRQDQIKREMQATAEVEDAKVKQAQEANRQMVKDEEESLRQRSAAWKAHFDKLNEENAAQEKANAAREKAVESATSLERQYSNLIRQIENLKAQYPEGTFDDIETQAREAREELRNLDKTSEDYADKVKLLQGNYQGLQRDMANAREETKKLDRVTESFWMNIQKFARWYIGGNFVVKIVNSLREALKTMKEVDTELANIQKVTDRTDAEMQKLAKSAYSAASAYGVSAQAYLESAAEFAKAGFGDQAEALAEVAIKTQLVGDVSADVADKFLIASNAAWKMNGNIEALNKTLDAANIIENNYATSIEKLAAGMPIAASVAANAGMTFEQTIAALGTITSVTQETGTKAATALRALILNIIGAVGEYEDGIEVTEESVKSLDGILQVYAKDALAAAKAAGTVVNPMEAIAALAKASEEGLVNQAELFEILSSLGGKLRTNQLISLVQNYGTYLEMLDKTVESAGSADREIGIMLDTWEAKTNILKNTWTEFVASFIDTDAIKDGLDVAIGLIELLNTDLGKTAIIAGGVPIIVTAIISALKPLYAAVLAHPILAAISAVVTVLYLAESAAKKAARAVEEIRDAATEAKSVYEKLTEQIKELERRSESLTDIEKKRLEILRLEANEAEKEAKQKALVAYYSSYSGGMVGNTWVRADAQEQARNLLKEYLELQSQLKNASTTTEMDALEKQIQETTVAITNMADDLLDLQGILGDELPEAGKNAIEILSLFISGLNKVSESEAKVENATEPVVAQTKSLQDILKDTSAAATAYDTAIGGVVTALTDFGEGSYEVYTAMQDLETAIPGSTEKLYDFDTATWKVDASLIESKSDLLDFIDTTKQLEFSQQISRLEELAAGYWDVAGAALAAMNAQAAQQMAGVLAHTGVSFQSGAGLDNINAQLEALKGKRTEWDAYIATLRQRSGYSGGGSGGTGTTGGTATDAELQKRQKIVELLKAELAFLKASGASTEEIVAKQREIQAALHDEADYLRSIGADETDVLALSTEWWNIQKDINKALEDAEETVEEIADDLERLKSIIGLEKQELSFLQASGASLDEINAKRKEIQASLHDQAEEMRRILAAMDDTNSTEAQRKAYEEDILALSTEWWNIQKQINDDLAKAEQEKLKALEEEKKLREEIFDTLRKTVDDYYAKILSDKQEELNLEERILAVQKAQEALANAKNERTVRIFNRETGQWEWVANQKNVKSAADALKKAQDDLNKYQRDQAWKEFKSAWEYVADQIKAGAMTFKEAYAYMYAEMKKIQDTYGVDLGFVLEDSIGGFEDLNITIDDLTEEVADTLGKSVGVLYEQLQEYEAAVGALKKEFDSASDKVKNGEMKMEDAYSYLRDRAKQIADKYGIDMTGALEEAISGMDKTNMSIDELWKAVIINLMKVNSARWFDANEEERAYLHAQNEFLGSLIGATYDPSGYWYLNGSQLYGSQKGGATSFGGGVSGGSGSSGGGGGGVRGAAGTGKFYDSYGNEYATLEDAVRGNAFISAQRDRNNETWRYNGSYNAYAWQDPNSWAKYSNLSEADPEYAEKLLALEAAVASGAPQEEIDALLNSLYSDTEGSFGYFGAIQGAGGTTGFVQGGYGNANGQKLLMLNGKLYDSDVKPGTMLQDLWGNRWAVGEDGHTLTKLLPAWYEDENGAKKAGYVYHATEDDNGQPVLGKQDIRDGKAWQIAQSVRNSDLGRAGADVMKDDTNYNNTRSGSTDVTNNGGDTYTFGGVTIGELKAKSMTVWEFAKMAASLGQYNG